MNYLNDTVSVYSESTLALERKISKGIACPTTMAMDKSGELYVANSCPEQCCRLRASGRPSRTHDS